MALKLVGQKNQCGYDGLGFYDLFRRATFKEYVNLPLTYSVYDMTQHVVRQKRPRPGRSLLNGQDLHHIEGGRGAACIIFSRSKSNFIPWVASRSAAFNHASCSIWSRFRSSSAFRRIMSICAFC